MALVFFSTKKLDFKQKSRVKTQILQFLFLKSDAEDSILILKKIITAIKYR